MLQIPGVVDACRRRRCAASRRHRSRRGGLGVVEIAQHHVRPAQQHLACAVLGGVVDAQLEVGDRPATGGGDGDGVVVGAAHRAEPVGLGQPVRGQHDVDVQLGLHAFDQHDRDHRRTGDREPQRGQVVVAALGMVEQRLVDRRRPGQHGDAMLLHGPHGPLGVERQLRDQRRPGLQARQDAGLVTEVVEERVDAEVAVVAGDLPALGPCRRAAPSDCRCAHSAPLLRPVVPEVNRMSETSSGLTAAARASTASRSVAAAR